MINGASPCNVYWQVGSSATLGTTTAFQGNLMALLSITLNNARHGAGPPAGAQRRGHPRQQRPRRLAVRHPRPRRRRPRRRAGTRTPTARPATSAGGGTPAAPAPPAGGTGARRPHGDQVPPGSRTTVPTRNGTAIAEPPGAPGASLHHGFRATVTRPQIKRVVFTSTASASPAGAARRSASRPARLRPPARHRPASRSRTRPGPRR